MIYLLINQIIKSDYILTNQTKSKNLNGKGKTCVDQSAIQEIVRQLYRKLL